MWRKLIKIDTVTLLTPFPVRNSYRVTKELSGSTELSEIFMDRSR